MLVPLDGRPLVSHVVRTALRMGCDEVVVVIGHRGAEVRQALERSFPSAPLRFAEQRRQRGTGHAVSTALRGVSERTGELIVLSGDVPLIEGRTLRRLVRARRKHRAALAMLTMRLESPSRYGRIVREGGRIARVVEFSDATPDQRGIREGNAGLYCLDLAFARGGLRRLKTNNVQGELYLTDLVALASSGQGAVAVECDPDEVRGVNTWVELAAVEEVLRRRVVVRLMQKGVRIQAPGQTWIESSVRVSSGASIDPGVLLKGDSRIGADVRIGAGVVVQDSRVGRGAQILPYSVLDRVRVAPRACVGPHVFVSGQEGETLPRGVKPINAIRGDTGGLGS